MPTKPAPATPLTFDGKYIYDAAETPIMRLHPGSESHAEYIVEALNAYPRLLAERAELATGLERIYQHAFDDDTKADALRADIESMRKIARTLLAQLGEAES